MRWGEGNWIKEIKKIEDFCLVKRTEVFFGGGKVDAAVKLVGDSSK